ncbi:probable Allantoicase [Phialocephala subalpina]|uniref:Probable Allantoicase n=1 Tax=Phialocephala subalpina TaxID=576137 RepID=A0A1L7XTA5_9HELO|nr:probable Allantoicase [Phialocephala subalpina]
MPRLRYELADVEATPIPADNIDSTFSPQCIDLISFQLGGRVLAVSDEWFAPATNLLLPKRPIYSEKQIFTGQWMDGWESRRHNKSPFDYTIIRLGVSSGTIEGIEIDTTFFKGNEAPAISVEGCFSGSGEDVVSWKGDRGKWEVILGRQPCGPSQRHGWKLASSTNRFTHVRLNMYPDGGIARFRLYGKAVPIFPEDVEAVFDLAAMQNGGMAVSWSDQEFGTLTSNLLLPGRGPDMADGWETSRSRTEDHVDWAVVKLGTRGKIKSLLLDTSHFRGNYPDQAQIAGIDFEGETGPEASDERWRNLTQLFDCGPDEERPMESLIPDQAFTHVKLSIFPDGGVKRLRVFGVRAI